MKLSDIKKPTYSQFDFFLLSVDREWPESLHVLDFEERDLRHAAILLEHVQGAGLRTLCTTGHARKVDR